MPAKKQKTPKPPPGPDDLVRKVAGEYKSGDGRFTVRQSDANWYLVDNEQTNEFGQELIHGPFGSLKQAREQVAGARTVKPLLRSQVRARPKDKRTSGRAGEGDKARAEPKAPPPSWIDKLDADEATEVRRLIRALQQEGVQDAESLVRRDRGGLLPAIANELLQRRLKDYLDKIPKEDRELAARVMRELGEIVSASERLPSPLPGWALFETGPGREPTKRRLRIGG